MAGKVILHVEDNAFNRKIVRDLFGRKGYTILEATDGDEALAIVQGQRPDLILMDIQLPKMSGLDVTRRLKAIESLRTVPIIAVTSFALSGDDQKAYEAGCDGYIAKPYSPRELLKLVEGFLGGSPG